MTLGPEHTNEWWAEHNPAGQCRECGGQCDGDDCGRHRAGCRFGGFSLGYWIIAEGCPLFHGEPWCTEAFRVDKNKPI